MISNNQQGMFSGNRYIENIHWAAMKGDGSKHVF